MLRLLVRQEYKDAVDKAQGLIQEKLKDHLLKFEDSIAADDMMDHMIKKVHTTADVKSAFYKDAGYAAIINLFSDLFVTGAETTATTLSWLMFLMILHPEVQDKVHQELDTILGAKDYASLSDVQEAPYTRAVILEAHRIGAIVGHSMYHTVLNDMELGKYKLPKGTIWLPEYTMIMWNPDYFPSPEKFDPARFLDKDGHFKPDEHVVQYGIGRRECPGQMTADLELALFFTGLMKNFKVSKVLIKDIRSMEKKMNMLNHMI